MSDTNEISNIENNVVHLSRMFDISTIANQAQGVYDLLKKMSDYIVKLINMLPFESEVKLDIPFIKGTKEVIKTVFSGDFDAQDAKPVESKTKLGARFTETLPAYSLTVLRFKK